MQMTKFDKIKKMIFCSKWLKLKKIPSIPLAFDGECKADFCLLKCGIAPNLISQSCENVVQKMAEKTVKKMDF